MCSFPSKTTSAERFSHFSSFFDNFTMVGDDFIVRYRGRPGPARNYATSVGYCHYNVCDEEYEGGRRLTFKPTVQAPEPTRLSRFESLKKDFPNCEASMVINGSTCEYVFKKRDTESPNMHMCATMTHDGEDYHYGVRVKDNVATMSFTLKRSFLPNRILEPLKAYAKVRGASFQCDGEYVQIVSVEFVEDDAHEISGGQFMFEVNADFECYGAQKPKTLVCNYFCITKDKKRTTILTPHSLRFE